MLKAEWTNKDSLDCNNTTCANCQYNDGVIYTSMPPQYKCTITNEFHHNNDKCDVKFAPIKHGHWIAHDMSIKDVPTEACSECCEWSYGYNEPYCQKCGAKMNEVKDE